MSPHEITGVGRYNGGWNRGSGYRVYFDLITEAPVRASRTWTGSSITNARNASVSTETPLGAILDFSTRANQAVHVKVGISFVSGRLELQMGSAPSETWGTTMSPPSASDADYSALQRIDSPNAREIMSIELRSFDLTKQITYFQYMFTVETNCIPCCETASRSFSCCSAS